MKKNPSTPEQAVRVRESSGLTQTQFGNELGVSLATVQRWEVGGMPALEYHHARMLYDEEYVARWIAQQAERREGLRSAILRKLSAGK